MSNKVILKRSSVSNKIPTTLDLSYGELALNYADGRLYYKTPANTVDYFSAGAGGDGGESVTVYSYSGLTVDTFTGNGTQTTFQLSTSAVSTNYSLVNIQGVVQPRSSYAIRGSSLIFENAPPSGAVVEITLFSAQPDEPISYTDLIDKPIIPSEYTLPVASTSTLGGVKVGSGLSIDQNGILTGFSGSYLDLSDTPESSYTLPTASSTVLGGVKIGSGITITNGVISVAPSFSGSYLDLTDTPEPQIGPTGPQGIQGLQGPTGPTGPQGPAGAQSLQSNTQTSSYQLVSTDANKYINISSGGVTVPANTFSAGDTVSIYNNSTSSQTVVQGSGVTVYLIGTDITGTRTLAQRGLATLLCVDNNQFVITGGGLS